MHRRDGHWCKWRSGTYFEETMAASGETTTAKENLVIFLQKNPFTRRSLDEQICVMDMGNGIRCGSWHHGHQPQVPFCCPTPLIVQNWWPFHFANFQKEGLSDFFFFFHFLLRITLVLLDMRRYIFRNLVSGEMHSHGFLSTVKK